MSHFWQSSHPYDGSTRALLHEEVLGGAQGWPDRVALLDAATGRSASYGEIADGARRLAGGLRAGGARDGDVLALVASNGIGFPIVAHGALLAGLTLAPAGPLLTARELSAFLRQTGARYAVADAGAMPTVREAATAAGTEALLALDALPVAEPTLPDGGDPDATALLLSTSGTSGLPKSAIHTHAGAVAALRQYAAAPPRFGPDDVVAGIVPFAHMFGWVMLNSALRAGARMVTLARFELEAFLRMIEDHRVSAAAVVPPIAHALARHPAVDRYDLSSLRLLVVGAAPCPAEIERECEARLGCVVGQGLGMTEAGPVALPEDPACHGSVGRLVARTQAVIVDPETGARLGAGRTGELWFRGPQLMRGYLGDAAATAATIDAEGWLHSGDLGHFDADGNLFLVDRLKELIKVRGYHVAPAQLEGELITHPAVADVAVVPRPDEESGEVPVAYVTLCAPAEPVAIAAWLAERVAPYKRLAEVVVVDAIPRAPTGKLLRRVLVERERESAAARRPNASVA
jgi:acyl-CoA synthetase (AMP-forming)/AMP-acid ligase II